MKSVPGLPHLQHWPPTAPTTPTRITTARSTNGLPAMACSAPARS